MEGKRNELFLDQPPPKPSLLDSLLLTGMDSAAETPKKRNAPLYEDSKEKPLTTAVPPSQVLGKVKDFLGVMAKAKEELERDVQNGSRANYDMEALNGNEKEYIQMNLQELLLGVADLQTDEAVAAAEVSMTCPHRSMSSPSSGSFDTDDDGDDIDDIDFDNEAAHDSEIASPERNKPMHKGKLKKKPKIVVLDQSLN